ncbi:MAG: hypothetical protein QXG05_04205 [Nitrososphaerota archaeon]
MLSPIIPVFILGIIVGYLLRKMRTGFLGRISLWIAVILLFLTGLDLGSSWLYTSFGLMLLLSLVLAVMAMIFGVIVQVAVEKR